jgi:hypothetical protein
MQRMFSAVVIWVCLLAAGAGAEERELLDGKNRFLDGSIDFSKAKITPSTFLIDSFEDTTTFSNPDEKKRAWGVDGGTTIEASTEHATGGKTSLKATFPSKAATLAYRRGTGGWGNPETDQLAMFSGQIIFNDELRLNVFNAETRPLKLTFHIGKPFTFDLKPGANEISMKTVDMVDFAYRVNTLLSTTKITVDTDKPATLFLDEFRWIGPGLGENLIKHAKCFDAGNCTEEGLRPYFLRLGSTTAYTKERGYGWEKPNTEEFGYNNATMLSLGGSGRQPHDQLHRALILRVTSPLLVDIPAGKYRVHWVEGHIFAYPGANLACDYSVSLKVGDKVVPVRKAAKDFAERIRYFNGRDRIDYMPGEDRWLTYMAPCYSPLEADIESTGDQLKLEFLTTPAERANLAFLIIYPVDKAGVIEPELAHLWNDIRFRFNKMSFDHVTPQLAQTMNLPGLHPEFINPAEAAARAKTLETLPAAKAGVLVFNRDCVEEVYPTTVPVADSIASEVSTAATPGEIASLSINLYAMKDVSELKVELAEFTSADGRKIAKDRCDLRFVRYSHRMSGQTSHGDWKFMILPWFMVYRDTIAMKKGMSVRYWLNVDLPADATPGKYTATATVSGKDVPAISLKLNLEVLPLKLDAVPADIEFSTLWTVAQEWAPTPDGGYGGLTLRMDPAQAKIWAATLKEATLKRCAAELNLIKRYGMNLVYTRESEGFKCKEFFPGGFLTLPPDLAKLLPMVDFKNVANRTYALSEERATIHKFDEATINAAKAGGKKPVLFGPPKNWSDIQQEYGIYRFCSGFFLWRMGAYGCLYDPWQCNWGDPYHPFDNHCGEWGSLCVPSSSADWPTLNKSVVLEGIREGIVDYRYLVTLERLIKENAGKPAAAAAQKYLDELRSSITPKATQYLAPAGNWNGGWDNSWHQKDTAWKGKDYAKAREQLALHLAALQGAK